jgi:uracil phosphoribosyltransferase
MDPTIVAHPLVSDRVRILRDTRTDGAAFRQTLGELSSLLAYEALRDLPLTLVTIDTPLAAGVTISAITTPIVLVPILRAGLGMIPAIQSLVHLADVAHVGLRRDEVTLESAVYLDRLPANLTGRTVVVCDPMLATGGSLSTACTMVKRKGATDVRAICVIASAPGLDAFVAHHPDVRLTCAAVDANLNANGYIVPGLGDAGDRLFGDPPE